MLKITDVYYAYSDNGKTPLYGEGMLIQGEGDDVFIGEVDGYQIRRWLYLVGDTGKFIGNLLEQGEVLQVSLTDDWSDIA